MSFNIPPLPKSVVLLGLGRSGIASALWLLERGINVIAWDNNQETREKAASRGIPLKDLMEFSWETEKIDALVLSPGIPHTFPKPHPVAQKAKDLQIPIIGDMELFVRGNPKAHLICITGTNGKSTTTSLIGHMLQEAKIPCRIGGNIGICVLDLAPIPEDGFYVIECSSFQLELTPSLHPEIALLLNITPDHLDRHHNLQGYVAAKKLIFNHVKNTAIIGSDDTETATILKDLQSRKSLNVIANVIPDQILNFSSYPALQGSHNKQNAAAAYHVAKTLGIDQKIVEKAFQSFPGLPHRQEVICVHDGIRYVNDSKATSVVAASQALATYKNILWIAGGRGKEESLNTLSPYFPNILHAYLIGEATDSFAKDLEGKIPFTKVQTLDKALLEAHSTALSSGTKNPTILLSPACTAFDQFKDFEARGDAFKRQVHELLKIEKRTSHVS
ncbi:MAG: UDP-N-acetylmuramoyl-L-alanine--D-glutamate ligase [Alphaproteobacteria bacterium]|nr:UDP-N-acetylmuramoyl-L-alanine--D-glutamate ligase [Alphaproteobacteria bacterium]MBT5390002.1 UDP-N-acetylmuramoyl-L-alanine--D-glutamate ligase [Alphaproteobacteria bacterium]MBT5540894.1 UDP-N-acetylmuramoyl-L-alanine--D-glutamate ligase [Alphaproteobacteria bacterium]